MKNRTTWILCLTLALVVFLALGVYATYTTRPELAKSSDAKRQNLTAVQASGVANSPTGTMVGRAPSKTSASEEKPDFTEMTSKRIENTTAVPTTEREGVWSSNAGLEELNARAKKLEPVPVPANIEERTNEPVNEDKDRDRNTLDAQCVLTTTNTFTNYYPGFFDDGDFVKVWFQPRSSCGATYTNYRIDSVEFYIAAGGAGTVYFQVDIECPNTPGDSLSGPGYMLTHPDSNIYSYTFTASGASRRKVNINPDVCVNHGFFAGIRFLYWTGLAAQGPSIVVDATAPAPGREWYCAPGCCDMRDIGFGRVASWVYGNAQDGCTPVACTTVPPCVVTSQTGDIIEATETPDSLWMETDPNGGCNNNIPTFGSIACGQTVFGHVFMYESTGGWIFRDTDSYMFTLTERDSVRWTVVSEEPVVIAIVDTNNACTNQEWLIASETAVGCTTSVTTWCLDPGTYVAFVTLTTFYCPPFPGAAYRGKLECFPCATCPPPANDDCANAGTPAALPATFTGNNSCATHDCDSLTGGEGETWHAFTITEACNVVVDYCGTGDWGDYYIALTTGCPCEGNDLAYPNRINYGCTDGNIQIFFDNLPAGTYYIPVLRDEGSGAVGPYTIHVYCRACTPDAIVNTIPQTVTGTTCGAIDDCYWRVGQDYLVQINIPTTGYYEFSLCGTTPAWDSYLYLSTECCGGSLILSNDDACSTEGLSAITCRLLQAGTYYLDIEPYYPDSCGAFSLVVNNCTPCSPAAPNDSCYNVTAVTLPATFTGDNTCATEDCPIIAGSANGEVWHAFMIAETCDVVIDYCGTEGFGVVYWVLFSGCPCSEIIYNDSYDYTSCGDGNLTYRFDRLPPGTYYIPVVRDDSTATGGPYTIHARCAPTCNLTCPTGGVYENEPTCAADYVDAVNGGCNSSPPVFGTATCGQVICGKSGTFAWQDTLRRRDTDWFRITLTQRSYITWQAVAEFPALLMVLDSTHCDSLLPLVTATGYACDTITTVTSILDPGEYWLYISPSEFEYVDCGADYYAWVTCTPCGVTCLTSDVAECTELPIPGPTDNDCNGGCNNLPNTVLYQQIACGQTICGVGYTYEPTDSTRNRDTDWYHFSLTAAETVAVHVEAEYPVDVFILNYDCNNIQVLASGESAIPCTPITLVSNGALAAGDYAIFVAPQYDWFYNNDGFVPYPKKYRVTLGCPCVTAKNATVYLNTALTNLVVRWIAQVPGNYNVFSTTDRNIGFNPTTWTLETTAACASGANQWTDPAVPVTFKRYVVQHVCQ